MRQARRLAAAAATVPARRVAFLGPPGCGKGTYASHCAPLLGVPHISVGDVLRDEMRAGTAIGKEVASFANTGRLVPDEMIFDILEPIFETDGNGTDAMPECSPREWLRTSKRVVMAVEASPITPFCVFTTSALSPG